MSFQKLKLFLTSTHIFALPEECVEFVVFSDASGVSFGGAMMKKERVIAYTSRQLKGIK